jgi:hypothetical protein
MKEYWGSGGTALRPGRFNTRERAPCTHWIGGRVGPRTVLDANNNLETGFPDVTIMETKYRLRVITEQER